MDEKLGHLDKIIKCQINSASHFGGGRGMERQFQGVRQKQKPVCWELKDIVDRPNASAVQLQQKRLVDSTRSM